MDFSFPKSARLLCSKEYFNITKQSHFGFAGSYIKINVRSKNLTQKLGITVSRRFGKATQRNRFKRLVREAFRLSKQSLPKDMHINVLPLQNAKEAKMQDIQMDLLNLVTSLQSADRRYSQLNV